MNPSERATPRPDRARSSWKLPSSTLSLSSSTRCSIIPYTLIL